MTSPVDIRPDQLEIVQDILLKHLPADVKVWVFGSRANWTTKDSSDLDLALEGESKLSHKVLGALKDAFEDSALPYTVDVVDLNRIGDSFRQIVESQRVLLSEERAATKGSSLAGSNGHWRRAALGDLIDLQLSSVDKKSKANEQAVQLCNYTDVYKNSFIYAGMDFMPATATEREIARCSLAAGDVVITKDSEKHDDIGVPALVREDIPNLVCGYHLAILRPRESVTDGAYLFYALSTDQVQEQFHSYANGITRFGLRKSDIGLVEIPLPPLPEQRAIAHILGTLDDKIELNRRMNETLEAMARALFKSWFVDFDPVRAKIEGRWRRGESLPGLPSKHYDLFPDRLVDSELGEIPEGWGVRQFSDIATQLRDNENPAASPDTEFSHFSIPAYDLGQTPKLELGANIKSTKSRVPQDTVLLSKLNPEIKRVWLVDVAPDERAICSTEFLVLKARPPFQSCYVYCLALSPFFRQQIESIVTGTSKSHQRAPANAILSLEAAVPPAQVIEAFQTSASGLLQRSMTLRREALGLAAQRDALVPGLVSGELQIEFGCRNTGE